MLDLSSAQSVISEQSLPLYAKERKRLDRVDLWLGHRHEDPVLPRSISPELRSLLELSRTPWLSLVVKAVVQGLYVDGYASSVDGTTEGPWKTWQANDFDDRQVAVYHAAVGYGHAFVRVLPGDAPDGTPMSVMRGVSPRKMVAVYDDPCEDDWPVYTLQVEESKSKPWKLTLLDDEALYPFMVSGATGVPTPTGDPQIHDSGVCPVVRYANSLDLDGRTCGEVEPYIPTAARINKTLFDRLLTQHYSSWKVRTIAGMEEPDTGESQRRAKLKLRQDDILIAEDKDTKFGTLDETPLDGFVSAAEADITHLAAVSQTPTTTLTGSVANLSADAIAELRDGLTQKRGGCQKSFGKSHEQALRLAAHQQGDDIAAGDVLAHVTWADMQNRSLAQAADGLGKIATMLGVPPQALWQRIPGVSQTEVAEWERMLEGSDPMVQLTKMLEAQIASAGAGAA